MSQRIVNPDKLIIAQIQKSIHDWIKTELGQDEVSVIWRFGSQQFKRPAVVLQIINGPERTGYSDNVMQKTDSVYLIGGQRRLEVRLQVYGNTNMEGFSALQTATDLNSSLSRQDVLDFLYANKIAVWDQGKVANTTYLEETEYEERAEFDIVIGVAENQLVDLGRIETVNVTPNVS